MKFTLSWLKQHLETAAPLETITERLTMIGLEVESVTDRAAGLEPFTVAHVVEVSPHPNADKLRVCRVDTGDEILDVVCGAPNAVAGMKGVFAAAGETIPGTDIKLKKAAIRGVESNGMLLSERELGLSDDHAGIIRLADDAPIGARAVDVMGLTDPVIDIAITPNRGDCLGVRGIARDLAAAGLGALKPLACEPVAAAFESPIRVLLEFDPDAADACPYFVGRYIRGVRNVESPKWLRDRLLAVGLRPISALVDITNLMTLDLCRPLHVFDADKVRGNLHVRLARRGETLAALNGRSYDLQPTMTVIADDEDVEALGGVIGGEPSGCTAETVNLFLESALFDPVRTASTGRELGILSDARYRFERGIDPSFLAPGIEIATRLILDLCGGEASRLEIAGAEPEWRRTIRLRRERIAGLGGVDVPPETVERILDRLGFAVSATDGLFNVGVPPWRADVVGEACLVEEVVRLYGYDRIPTVALPRPTALSRPAFNIAQRRRTTAIRALAERGLIEAVTYSFQAAELAELFGGVQPSLRLVNPISADLDVMRPSLLPNLIAAIGRNAARGIANAALFEVGPQYAGDGVDEQSNVAAGIRSGQSAPRNWATPPRPVDAFDAKADALALLEYLGVPVDSLQVSTDAPSWYHPGRSGVLRLGPQQILARFGELHPRILGRTDVKGPAVAFEVFLDALPVKKARTDAARPPLRLSSLQPVERDFAFLIDADVPASTVIRAARNAENALITDINVFDVFVGDRLGPGKKSLAINVVLQPSDKTLTDAEIDAIGARIVAAVTKASGGSLRE